MATAIRGRIVRLSTKAPLIDIEIQAIDVATGDPDATTTTSDAYGFYSLTGLTDAVYFANPLIADDDWTIQPDTNVIYGGDIYVPDSTTTPRVQITTAAHGGFAILGSGDTYDDSTGLGTYEVLFDYAKSPVGMYFADGAAYIGSAGITIQDGGVLNITGAFTGGTAAAIDASITHSGTSSMVGMRVLLSATSTSGGDEKGFFASINNSGTGSNDLWGVQGASARSGTGNVSRATGVYGTASGANATGTLTTARGVWGQAVNNSGTTTSAYGGYFEAGAPGGTLTTGVGVYADVTAGTNRRGVQIAGPISGANNYALYSDAAAQSVHAGSFGLGSTTAPSTIFHIRQDAAIEVRAQASGGNNSDYSAIVHSNTVASPTATANGQSMTLGLRGYDNAGTPALTTVKAYVQLKATENWTTAAQGTAIDFATTAAGSTTRAVQLSIDSSAGVFTNSVGLRGTTPAAGFSLDDVAAAAGTSQSWRLNNSDNTNAASHARQVIQTGGGSAGDPFTRYIINGVTDWSVGIDNSDSDSFVIAASSALGTTNRLRLTTAAPAAYTQTYSTATRTHSNITAVAPSAYAAGANGYSTGAKAQEVHAAVVAHQTDIANVKQVLNQVIDDLQLYGLLA